MHDPKQKIKELIKEHIKTDEIPIEIPPNAEMGDYAVPCFVFSKLLRKNPVEISKELSKILQPAGSIERIESKGPYLNFFLKKENIASSAITEILKQKDDFGKQKKANKTIVIEYVGPNTNKPLHLGHARNMVLGYTLSKLLEAAGNKVITVNINNDRGVHICKSMLAYKKWGKGDSPEKSKSKSDFFVGKYYVLFAQKAKENPKLEEEALEMINKWEKGDKETAQLWKKMNKWALDGFKETYKKFNVKFDKEYFESKTYEKGKELVLEGLKKGLFEKDEKGAIIVDLTNEGFDKKVLLRQDGTSVYITQDMYLAKQRYDDFRFDKMLYVVATEQNYHFQVLFKVLKLLGFSFADKLYHFAYGMVNLTTGKMKSREGTVVDADTLLEEIETLAKEETRKRHKNLSEKELEKRAKQLGMAAIRFYLLKYEPAKDILFDPKESLSFEGETGPYVQYAHARICSILKKYKKPAPKKADFSLLNEKEEQKLVTLLSQYPETVKQSAENCKPHIVARYLLDLSQSFNEFYHSCPILQADENIRDARLILIIAVKQVLKNGLNLLGIEAPEGM